jgi:hypothetical protein
MSGFRIGRSHARHFYPESPRGGATSAFARNFASGPTDDTVITGGAGTQIPWSAIDVGAPGVNVQITPQTTGVIRITAVVVVGNVSTDPATVGTVQINVQVNNVVLVRPNFEQFSVDINGFKSIQIVAETAALPIGVPVNIQVLATLVDGTLNVTSESSTVEAQEVSTATG